MSMNWKKQIHEMYGDSFCYSLLAEGAAQVASAALQMARLEGNESALKIADARHAMVRALMEYDVARGIVTDAVLADVDDFKWERMWDTAKRGIIEALIESEDDEECT